MRFIWKSESMNNYAKCSVRKGIRIPIMVCLLIIFLSGCSSTPFPGNAAEEVPFITKSDFLLNTVVTINLYDKQDQDILEDCFDLISKYENIYSRTSERSELYQLNHGTAPHDGLTYKVSDELADIIQCGLFYSELSDGFFDISIAPITSLWDFTASDPVLPEDEDLKAALPLVSYKNIQLIDHQVTFAKEGMGLEFGAIAKGYIADRVKEFLLSKGVKSAMINLGGNVLCVGEKPEAIPFQVGIQKPFADRNETIAVMEINDQSVVSSGIYERNFTLNGVNYHHILDPKTGYPYDNELVGVTIISKKSTDGDGLSTTCFALGLEKGLALIASLPDTYAVFITKDYEVYYSNGFEEAITLVDQ